MRQNKLNAKQIHEIRLLAKYKTGAELSRMYKVSQCSIHNVIYGKFHKSIDPSYQPPVKAPCVDKEYCRGLRKNGFSYAEIGKLEASKHCRRIAFTDRHIRNACQSEKKSEDKAVNTAPLS